MAQLTLVPHSTVSLYRIPAKGQLVGEASEMGIRPGHQWERLYDDACDVGIALQSHKTGVTTRWYLLDTERDAEGDITCWKFRPCSESARKSPEIAAYTLVILND
jgi:hypothetical protein